MIYLSKRITFDIYLLKSEIIQRDYMMVYEDTDPSNVVQVGFPIKPLDVGEEDPSFGDAFLFKTETMATSVIETRSFFYTIYDQYENAGTTSDSFSVKTCLTPISPTLSNPVYNDGAGELTFDIGQ